MIRAVIFDLDGVITDSNPYHFMSWKKVADEEGIAFEEKIAPDLKGLTREASLEFILNKAGTELPHKKRMQLLERKNLYYQEYIADISSRDLFPGVTELLKDLKTRGLKLAVASASKNATVILERLGLLYFFYTVIDGNMVSKSKPDPEVFNRALDALDINPDEAVVIEDAEAGAKAARAAGIRCIGIGLPGDFSKIDYLVSSIEDVTTCIIMGSNINKSNKR